MPSNENIPGNPEYYEKVRQIFQNLAESSGIPVIENPDGSLQLAYAVPEETVAGVFRSAPASPARPAEDPYAATTWGLPDKQPFTCPSGQRCLLRRVDIMDLLGTSMLNKLDFLTSIVSSEHIPNASGKPSSKTAQPDVAKALQDKQSLMDFRAVIDDTVIRVVVRPEIHPIPPEGEDRVDGLVYVDSVSFTDKTEIFNWAVRGQNVDDLKRFREESQ